MPFESRKNMLEICIYVCTQKKMLTIFSFMSSVQVSITGTYLVVMPLFVDSFPARKSSIIHVRMLKDMRKMLLHQNFDNVVFISDCFTGELKIKSTKWPGSDSFHCLFGFIDANVTLINLKCLIHYSIFEQRK